MRNLGQSSNAIEIKEIEVKQTFMSDRCSEESGCKTQLSYVKIPVIITIQ